MEINVENFVDECNRINKEKEEMKKLIMELIKDYFSKTPYEDGSYYIIKHMEHFRIENNALIISQLCYDDFDEYDIPLDYVLDKLKEKSNE